MKISSLFGSSAGLSVLHGYRLYQSLDIYRRLPLGKHADCPHPSPPTSSYGRSGAAPVRRAKWPWEDHERYLTRRSPEYASASESRSRTHQTGLESRHPDRRRASGASKPAPSRSPDFLPYKLLTPGREDAKGARWSTEVSRLGIRCVSAVIRRSDRRGDFYSRCSAAAVSATASAGINAGTSITTRSIVPANAAGGW